MALGKASPRKATMLDVAGAAGISRGTVSRYVRGRGYVSPDSRRRIDRAIAQVGYVPNAAAQMLAGAPASNVALIVHEEAALFAADPNLTGMMVGANRALTARGLQLVVLIAGEGDDLGRLGQTIRGGLLDAAMLASTRIGDPIIELVRQAGLPAAVVGRHPDLPEIPAVDVDNRAGAAEIVGRMLERGQRQVGMVAGPSRRQSALDRLDGFRLAAGPAFDAALVVEAADWSYEAGLAAGAELLRRAGAVEAVFGANDALAAAFVDLATAAGRSVPGDVAVVGFDDSDWARRCQPQLCTVAQPAEALGAKMAEFAIRQIEGEDLSGTLALEPTRLVWRDSA
ncbi:MAG: LacI family transcriptional regulator [Bifidobacteriaceae bacterium]|jgi:DNA-binding LacI/PurR family transcriptional regulator|nr:LacI family transcriptional regulator [Bifidobacteriaceae bacterium]